MPRKPPVQTCHRHKVLSFPHRESPRLRQSTTSLKTVKSQNMHFFGCFWSISKGCAPIFWTKPTMRTGPRGKFLSFPHRESPRLRESTGSLKTVKSQNMHFFQCFWAIFRARRRFSGPYRRCRLAPNQKFCRFRTVKALDYVKVPVV